MGKVEFLIDGYNDDARELAEIPEVALWLKEAARTVKYLIYFLCLGPLPLGQGIRMAMAAHWVMRKVDGGLIVEDPAGLMTFTDVMFEWLNEFTTRYDLEEFNRQRSE
jgi:hypothetical protein